MKDCDCFIGFLSGEKINKLNIHHIAEGISDSQSNLKQYGLIKGDVLTPKQIVDNRRGYLSRFAFCPYCGEKIDWKEILNKF